MRVVKHVVVRFLTGTQGASDWNAAAELGGGAVQSAELPGAAAVSLRELLPGGVRRPEDGRAGGSARFRVGTEDARTTLTFVVLSPFCSSTGEEASVHFKTNDAEETEGRCGEKSGA